MTPEEQRIAIAWLCGWNAPQPGSILWTHGDAWADEDHLPDYLHDLNAMHEAEKVMTPEQQTVYRTHLARITTVRRYPNDLETANAYCDENEWAYCHSTAHQRAEAFLRTIGKWKD